MTEPVEQRSPYPPSGTQHSATLAGAGNPNSALCREHGDRASRCRELGRTHVIPHALPQPTQNPCLCPLCNNNRCFCGLTLTPADSGLCDKHKYDDRPAS